MGHTPYGYRIENAVAVIQEEEAEVIRKLFDGYLVGLGLTEAAKQAGLQSYHSTVGRILSNQHYLGDDYYPAIVEQDIFAAAAVEREKRKVKLGRMDKGKKEVEALVSTEFYLKRQVQKFHDPFQQATYVYSQIESKGGRSDGN